MRKFFNSKESYAKQQIKDRLRKKRKRRLERERVLRQLLPESTAAEVTSKLAEALAALSVAKQKDSPYD